MAPCPSCGRDVAAGSAFCPHCGAAVEAAPTAGEERKLVTLLFADVTGSTKLAEALDAEVVRDLMGEYFALAREEIEARGGTVEKFIGDAVMAVFGVPVTHEDDPSRALQAGLAIRSRLVALNEGRRSEGGPQLQVRIGVNTGEVVATTRPRPGEGMVTGDAVNVAARIQQEAEPGQIVVGERTAAAAPTFTFRDLGAHRLRGKASPVAVRELVGEAAGVGSRGVHGLRSPLVGRDAELDLLVSLYDRVAAEGRPHLVTLYGEPGVGKSRLTVELLATLGKRSQPPQVVRGRCLSYGSGVTFWPLAEILKSQAGILDSDPPDAVVRKVTNVGERVLTTGVAQDPPRATALLGYTVGIAVPGYEFERLEPEQLRVEIHGAWRSFFSALAAMDGPLVVVIDDIHWADGALLDLIEDVSERVEGSVYFLCPSRPDLTDGRPGWGGGRRSFSSVFLDPLPPAATTELVDQLLQVAELPPALRARIVERADGNPFFVEEILRQLIDEGRIVRSGDGWRAAPDVSDVEIPDTVQAVLAARIDLLGSDQKRTLQAAAVVGRIFWPAPVARFLNGAAGALVQHLRELEARDLILSRLASTMAGQPEYIFKHALVRDVAYESIPRRERAAAHLRVADWIEEAVGERRIEVVELLAHHYTEAQRAVGWAKVEPSEKEQIRARAVGLLFEAAREAALHLSTERARERVDVGLQLAAGPIERATGLEILVRLDLWADNGDAAWRSAREAIDLRIGANSKTPEERRAIARLAGTLLAMPTRWPGLMRHLPTREESAPYLELGFAMADDGDSEERLRLLTVRGAWCWGFAAAETDPGRIAADRAAAMDAVAMARRMDRVDLLSAALDALGATAALLEGYGAVAEVQEERLDLIPRLDDKFEVIDIYSTTAWSLAHIGQFRRAADLARRGAELATAFQVHNFGPHAFLGVSQYRLGEWDAVLATFSAVQAFVDPGRPLRYHIYRLFGTNALIQEVAGDSAEADRLIERLNESQAAQAGVGASGARMWIVSVLARRRAFDEARRWLAIEDPVRGIQNRDLDFEAWAELIAAEGAWAEASAIVADARGWAARTGLLFLPAVADRLDGQAGLVAGEPDRAVVLLERARDTFSSLEAPWDRARTELSLARAYVAASRVGHAAQTAQAALTTFRQLKAPIEIAEAEALVAAHASETTGSTTGP
ncbi:MAG TPA: adenylate/guanylate cyclase domain-containing protein [Pleomorphomonadaceae bacterium]|nr:adenylate/guanylate cyclase domain-containing protein [Pleomorphomonadaceae bacterium]